MHVRSSKGFSNVYIFVSDALRYDHVPDAVADDNEVVKTVSSSGVSCTAFSTIVSGLYPPRHGVWKFSDVVPDSVTTFYDLFPGNAPSHMGVSSVVESRSNAEHYNDTPAFESALGSLEEPFFVMDRELASHAVYGQRNGVHIDDDEREFSTTDEYWEARGSDLEAIRRDYQRGAEVAADAFRERLDVLEDNGLLEDTLVVFTADHGEALGEHGMVGHTNVPLAPEVVYVPTVFYNDEVSVGGDIMGHVDLLPTIAALTGKTVPADIDGVDRTREASGPAMFFNADRRKGGHVYGAWDADGGHTFSSVPLHLRIGRALERLSVNNRTRLHWKLFRSIASLPVRQSRSFCNPAFDRETAADFCDDVFSRSVESESRNLEDDAKGRLRALGYVEEDF